MTVINNRASVLSVRIESVEGTPELASASGDFIALQEDFTFSPETEVLENAEIRGGIAKAKGKHGITRVNGSLSHYVRASGVEGQAPNWGVLLESLLGGKDVESTEYDTDSGSTTLLIELPTNEGLQFRKGQGLLLKDSVNGRSVRNVETANADNLDVNFALSAAPGSGVNLGKNVGYYGVDTGQKTLTLDLFRGNDGSREVASGCKVTEMSVEVEAGQFVNGAFTILGTKYHFDALKTTSTNKYLDFNDGSSDYNISVAEKVWADPAELAEAIQTAMNDTASADTFSVYWNDYGTNKGKFTIETDGSTLSLEWLTGTNNANTIGDLLGFSTAADDTGSTTYTSDTAQDWSCDPIVPAYDNADPQVAKAAELMLGDQDENINVCARSLTLTVGNEVVERPCISAETGLDSIGINGRTVTVEINATLEKHEQRYMEKFRKNDSLQFMLNFGEKEGGAFQAGKTVNMYSPAMTIQSIAIEDEDGDAVLSLTLQAHVINNETEEFFLNFL